LTTSRENQPLNILPALNSGRGSVVVLVCGNQRLHPAMLRWMLQQLLTLSHPKNMVCIRKLGIWLPFVVMNVLFICWEHEVLDFGDCQGYLFLQICLYNLYTNTHHQWLISIQLTQRIPFFRHLNSVKTCCRMGIFCSRIMFYSCIYVASLKSAIHKHDINSRWTHKAIIHQPFARGQTRSSPPGFDQRLAPVLRLESPSISKVSLLPCSSASACLSTFGWAICLCPKLRSETASNGFKCSPVWSRVCCERP